MRVGIVGGGYWGSKHVRVLSDLDAVDQVVLVEPRPERRQELCHAHPGLRAETRLDDALDDVDALVVATPAGTHAELAGTAIEAGKHVLVEKPLAVDVGEANDLVAAADRAGVTLMVGHTFEYSPAVRRLRDVVSRGELGRVLFLHGARLNLGLYQPDVNVVWDLAPHDVSIANFVLGSTPDVVQAWGGTHAHTHLEDVAYLRLEYESIDVSVLLHLSWLDPVKVRRTTVVGSRAMAVYDDLSDDGPIRIHDKGLALPEGGRVDGRGVDYRRGDAVSVPVEAAEPLALEDQHFVDCAGDGHRPQSDGRSGLAVVEVLTAAQRSLRDGGPVRIDEVRPTLARAV